MNIPLNTIVCGDSLVVLEHIPDDSVDIVVTSPPYNFDIKYDEHNDTSAWDEYFSFLRAILQECFRVLKPGGRLCLNIQNSFQQRMPTNYVAYQDVLKMGFKYRTTILWYKQNYSCSKTAFGSWLSSTSPSFFNPWEYIDIYYKGDAWKKPIEEGRRDDITDQEFMKCVNAYWDIPPAAGMVKEFGHPAVFPEEIPRRLIRLLSAQGDTVLDPFNGSGTTTLVACKNHRNFIGIDMSKKYCETALMRVNNFLNQPDFFEQNDTKTNFMDLTVKKVKSNKKSKKEA